MFAELSAARADYQRLTARYDRELQAAHDAHHGTPEFMLHLKAANAMSAEITEALRRYMSAVAHLLEYYRNRPAKT